MDSYDKKRLQVSIAVCIMGLISLIIALTTLSVSNQIPKIIAVALGAFAMILNHDEGKNGGKNPLLGIGMVTGTIGTLVSLVGIINHW